MGYPAGYPIFLYDGRETIALLSPSWHVFLGGLILEEGRRFTDKRLHNLDTFHQVGFIPALDG